MDFGNADVKEFEEFQRLAGRIILEREMAGVEVHPDATADRIHGGCLRFEVMEEPDGFHRVLEMPQRLGLQPEVEIMAGIF